MERKFINNNFHYATLISLENGQGWSLDALCKQIASKFYTRDMDADHIIVWLDREKQQQNCDQMRAKIVEALAERGADPKKIAICLADRMSENIILSDEHVIREEFGYPNYVYAHEGQNGKHILRDLFRTKKGIAYKETLHGTQLLKKIRLSRCAKTSPSIAHFISNLNIKCWWIEVDATP